MKQGIHPDYHPVVFEDSSTGYKFLSGSTATSSETVKWEDGNEYPLIRVEVTSDSHFLYPRGSPIFFPTPFMTRCKAFFVFFRFWKGRASHGPSWRWRREEGCE